MTVKLKFVPQEHWEILKRYLDAEGVVLVPESNEAGVNRLVRHGFTHNQPIDYDFGGDANVWVDFAFTSDSYAINELCDQCENVQDFKLTHEVIEELGISCLTYGTEDVQSYFGQTCCNQEYPDGDCGCRLLGENFTK